MRRNAKEGARLDINVLEGFPRTEIEIRCAENSDEVQKIVAAIRGCEKKLSGFKDGAAHLIEPGDVLYFESVDGRCFAYTARDAFEIPLRLYEAENLLADANFFRSAKSQIVNIAQIESLCPDFGGRMEVRLKNGERLIVSRQYAKILKERMRLK